MISRNFYEKQMSSRVKTLQLPHCTSQSIYYHSFQIKQFYSLALNTRQVHVTGFSKMCMCNCNVHGKGRRMWKLLNSIKGLTPQFHPSIGKQTRLKKLTPSQVLKGIGVRSTISLSWSAMLDDLSISTRMQLV